MCHLCEEEKRKKDPYAFLTKDQIRDIYILYNLSYELECVVCLHASIDHCFKFREGIQSLKRKINDSYKKFNTLYIEDVIINLYDIKKKLNEILDYLEIIKKYFGDSLYYKKDIIELNWNVHIIKKCLHHLENNKLNNCF